MTMRTPKQLNSVRDARDFAHRFAAGLDPSQRKRLGQYFSGLSLGRLLASVALAEDDSTVVDPMAGHGDLLDAVIELAYRKYQALDEAIGLDIDRAVALACRRRLNGWKGVGVRRLAIRSGDAFDTQLASSWRVPGYDLVITNPPYVRYQSLGSEEEDGPQRGPDEIRQDLLRIVQRRVDCREWPIWRTLIEGYSGFADLSVPAWFLAASLVRPGGRLALVAPATWRSRDYGDTVQYLLARCFSLEYVVEDTQPGWFSDALVRTQLVVARRCLIEDSLIPLSLRPKTRDSIVSLQVSPSAGDDRSLVGSAFRGMDPEVALSKWLRDTRPAKVSPKTGITHQTEPISDSEHKVLALCHRGRWIRHVEPNLDGPLFGTFAPAPVVVPDAIRPLFDEGSTITLTYLEDVGIHVGQGLRTGCNGFFYVDWLEDLTDDEVVVRASPLFGETELVVPRQCLRPVVRRQSDLRRNGSSQVLGGRVLDLNGWILPEDLREVEAAARAYKSERIPAPRVMPEVLADHVRRAATTVYDTGKRAVRVPQLSAVVTNSRPGSHTQTPRFWYMLPPFARRHQPDAYIARINQETPRAVPNSSPPVLIDANFSTFWSTSGRWTPTRVTALLNSVWCRSAMESIGTPLGGGALKVEASHLRRLPIPRLSDEALRAIDKAIEADDGVRGSGVDGIIIESITRLNGGSTGAQQLIKGLNQLAVLQCKNRQRN